MDDSKLLLLAMANVLRDVSQAVISRTDSEAQYNRERLTRAIKINLTASEQALENFFLNDGKTG